MATTLRQIAEQSDSLEGFGRRFRDWLHELRRWSFRAKVAAALAEEPKRLTGLCPGAVALPDTPKGGLRAKSK